MERKQATPKRLRLAHQESITLDAERLRLSATRNLGHAALERPTLRVVPPLMGELIEVDFTPLPKPPDIVA